MSKLKKWFVKLASLIVMSCTCMSFVSCGNEELHIYSVLDGKDVQTLSLILSRYESPYIRWYVEYSEYNTNEQMQDHEIVPFNKKDYQFFSKLDELENLYISCSEDVSTDICNDILCSLPDAKYIGFDYCPNADFSLLMNHQGFEDIAFTGGCDVSSLPIIDTKNIGFGYCLNIPWEIVRQMDTVEQIRYSCKTPLDHDALMQISQMRSLKKLYYYSFPYEKWNWGTDSKNYTEAPYKIESLSDVEEWVFESLDKESLESFFNIENRTLILFPYLETNPGIG
ncbi:MAG: hypothetical protein IJ091_04235 [Oscillospiraceae bacterium]|nr:hypothetical protein [Oscillospiraceae bacterium]